jgi:hypothetical protein
MIEEETQRHVVLGGSFSQMMGSETHNRALQGATSLCLPRPVKCHTGTSSNAHFSALPLPTEACINYNQIVIEYGYLFYRQLIIPDSTSIYYL